LRISVTNVHTRLDKAGRYGVGTWLSSLGAYTIETSQGLDDVKNQPFESEIRQAISWGLSTGFPDGTFRPSSPVTREQMATIIVGALN